MRTVFTSRPERVRYASLKRLRNSQRGMTLVEATVSVGIMAFIMSFVGYLIFMSSINAYNVHEQVLAQNSASMASQRLASLLRDSTSFVLHPSDAAMTSVPETLSRILFTVPPPETPAATETTSTVCFRYGTDGKPGEIWYFADASKVSYSGSPPQPSGSPTMRFSNIRDFTIHLESDFRLQLQIGFDYRGFAFVFHEPSQPMVGRFTTDVIARNHYMSYGPNGRHYEYAYDENLTSTPVTL